MASTKTDAYSPFQQELLTHICQISTNVNTLIQVFINLQSQLTPNNLSAQISPNKHPISNTNTHTKPITNNIPIIEEQTAQIQITAAKTQHKSEHKSNQTQTDSDIKSEQKIDTDSGIIPLSLDSDDENATNTNTKPNTHLKTNKFPSKYSWKHRNRFGLNRSKSTSHSASMTSLLRANHIRNHKYNGLLKGKYKKKCNDNKSENISKSMGPKFNPEHVLLSKNNRININVGGSMYETTLNTLSADQSSMLSAMFSGRFKIERDENGSIFIDRDPTHFRHILNFLRDGIEYLKHGGLLQQPEAIVNELLQEAKYYNIRPLVDYIQLQQTRKHKKTGDELTHEKQYKLVTSIAIDEFEDVFNKYTGSAGYDFEEWMFVSPYKTSRNSQSQPTFVMLFSKKLSKAEVRLLDRLTNIDFQ